MPVEGRAMLAEEGATPMVLCAEPLPSFPEPVVTRAVAASGQRKWP